MGKRNDKEIARQEVSIKTLTAHNSDYRPYANDSNFSIFWPHSDDVLSDDPVTIESKDNIWLDVNKLDIRIFQNRADSIDNNSHPFLPFDPDLEKHPIKPMEVHDLPDMK